MKTTRSRNASTRGKSAAAPARRGGGVRARDPYLEREQSRYENPLPSREYILELLLEQGVPVSAAQLSERLAIKPEEQEAFDRRLAAMERDGQVMRNRKNAICVVEKLDLVKGRVQGHPDGFGFLIRDDGGDDLYLNAGEMAKVLHGDRVVASEGGVNARGRREGHIVEVLERANSKVVGRYLSEHGIGLVAPEDRRISQDILIPAGAEGRARPGQVVVAEIIEQPQRHGKPVGRIVEILGNYADPGMEIEIALRKHDLPHEFPGDVETLAAKLPSGVTDKDLQGRKDLRGLPLVTIDGETAKDFDDAVYCERRGKGYKLWVAIADVSHYVRPGDALDQEARLRGNSVYFPRRVIPMLPEVLSNGLCSLNPKVDRLCMACEMDISPRGEIASYKFYPAVMHSRARLTYTRVAQALAGPQAADAEVQGVLPHLQALNELFQALVKARWQRGAIDFETVETQMFFDEQGKIERIVPTQRNDAHRIIEECMLAANVCASDFLAQNGHAALYRIHEGPTPEKLAALREFLREFGLQLTGGDAPQAKDYARLLEKVKVRPDVQLLQTVMLRSLRQAVYSPDNVGHFGLAYDAYTHFTSPIRRYPDLVIHRSIRAVLEGKRYDPGDWNGLGARCSETERRADEATRDVEAWLKSYYMRDRINERFSGTVSGVASFGVFVALDQVYVEGLVHISELGLDYFHYDAAKHQLLGERTGRRFRLGDRISVRLVRVDIETAKIDFVLDEGKGKGS
ncbi:MAG TPA: ribonuclease R [Burkholderiales bacterium]|nr:ribonuclease R [Burkholderiales bacterium]